MEASRNLWFDRTAEGLRQRSDADKDFWTSMLPYVDLVVVLSTLGLDPVRPLLERCYSSSKAGRPCRDPVAMLRSFVAMAAMNESGINRWVDRLSHEPILSILCGFGNDPPGVGTHYDFLHRIEDGDFRRECDHYRRLSRRYEGSRGRYRRNLSREKEQARAQAELVREQEGATVVKVREATAMLQQGLLPKDLLGRLEEILWTCSVVPSARMGLLGDMQLDLAGDGSALESHACPRGKSTCPCRKDGVPRCACDRSYTDPDARWGYDSYRERWVFGHRLHAVVAKQGTVELPLHLMIAAANAPDVLMGVEAFARLSLLLKRHLPEATVRHIILDAGYDATAMHRFALQLGASPVIALNERNFKPADDHGLQRDAQGHPLCKAGLRMRLHGYDKATGKRIYNCPVRRPGRKGGKQHFIDHIEECPLGCLCDPDSVMGPIVHVAVNEDPRLDPPIPRGSDRYKLLYAKRTCTERFFSVVKEAGRLGKRPYRLQSLFLLAALARSICIHAKAQFGHLHGITGPPTHEQVKHALVPTVSEQAA